MSTAAVKVQQLEQAITYLKYARYQVQLALGSTDSAQSTVADINGIMEDLDADIVFYRTAFRAELTV